MERPDDDFRAREIGSPPPVALMKAAQDADRRRAMWTAAVLGAVAFVECIILATMYLSNGYADFGLDLGAASVAIVALAYWTGARTLRK